MREKRYTPFISRHIIIFLMLVSAVCFVWGGFLLAGSIVFIKSADKITGTVTGIDVTKRSGKSDVCNAYVEYTVNGITYEYYYKDMIRKGFINKDDYIGCKVSLLCRRGEPLKVRPANRPYGASPLIVFAGAAAAAGCYYLVKRNRFYRELIDHGLVLDAVVTDVENRSERGSSRYTYGSGYAGRTRGADRAFEDHYSIVICEWVNTLTGDSFEFRSKLVKEFMGMYIGQTVRVYVDPNDYSKYFVDIDDLLLKPFVS